MNYINALPDFLAMQRISFCWFITQGLNEELALFSKIQDFSQNTEYLMFGNEYSLIKPTYNLLVARKYSGNYRAQLVIPIEVRNKTLNTIRYQTQFPIITLPLMTTDATFIINGCERVIVSQIIRSPGIYFEKNKNQKTKNLFKRKLSTDIDKLRSFIPAGEAFISEFDLFFPIPTPTYDPIKKRKKIVPHWKSNSIYYYSIKYLQEAKIQSSFYFLISFKFYRMIVKMIESPSKSQLIQLFLKWIKLNNQSLNLQSEFKDKKILYLLKYFNFLIKLLIKYQTLQLNSNNSNLELKNQEVELFEQFKNVNQTSSLLQTSTLSDQQILNLYLTYDKIITKSQSIAQIQVNSQSFLILKKSQKWLTEFSNFGFLKKQIDQLIPKLKTTKQLI